MSTLNPFIGKANANPQIIITDNFDNTKVPPFILNFTYQFHAVGQGLFASGELFNHVPECYLSWIYDCGTSSKTAFLERETSYFLRHLKKTPIDLVCLSHFDEDHVKGIETLLSKHKVKNLVMPYFPLVERIEIALGAGEISSSYLDFLVNPAGHMIRVAEEGNLTVTFVAGGNAGANSNSGQGDIDTRSLPGEPLWLIPPPELRDFSRYDEDLHGISMDTRDMANTKLVGHRDAFRVASEYGTIWEFMFFNKHIPDQTLSPLHDTVVKILRDNRLPDGTFDGPTLIHELKQTYGKHLGDSGEARNEISLVVYSGPITCDGEYQASFCGAVHPATFSDVRWVPTTLGENPFSDGTKVGIGYFGDLSLKGKRNKAHIVDQIRNHFGSARWAGMEVVQIPHHGSANSWPVGTAGRFGHHVSVISSARASSDHPAQQVLNDLSAHGVVLVNEYQRAIFCGQVEGNAKDMAMKT